jgi:hypothetical protein
MINQNLLEAAANWWVEQVTGAKLNWDNGAWKEGTAADREIGMKMFMLGNSTALSARRGITPEKVTIFRDTLMEGIRNRFAQSEKRYEQYPNEERYTYVTLSVDYHPGELLREAADKAGIDDFAFPCKSVMWIDDKKVEAKCGYGADSKIIASVE